MKLWKSGSAPRLSQVPTEYLKSTVAIPKLTTKIKVTQHAA